ncbi:hypothetical protein [Streptomyces sp. 7N604]|uniref:hypothetical protein n=1 Tax=Streptomyces sp. 7N604 TaxID=3457415 RepID=UPI003FD08F8B
MNTMTVSNAPGWVDPHGLDVRTLPAGRWWDAVRVPIGTGVRALTYLGDETGPVIKDGYGGILYWLIRPGSADHWQLRQVQVLGSGWHVAVPPQHRTYGPGLHWRVPPSREEHRTRPELLHCALSAALDDASERRPLARVCCRCERTTEAPVLVRVVASRSGTARAVYACPDCVHHCPAGPGQLEWRTTTR